MGASVITGVDRYTFGAVPLLGGVSLVALALGLFAIPQMIMIFGTATTVARQDMTGREVGPSQVVRLEHGFGKQVMGGVLETFRHWALTLQSAVVGVITGLIPGIGGFAANFLSYGIAQQTTGKRHLFGTGIAEGIIAPEGSSLAKEAGGLVPIIALGIPGGVGGALFLAALEIKGIKVGYGFTSTYPTLPYEMMWVIAIAGLIGTVMGLVAAPFLAKVTRVPGPLIVPFVLTMTVIGAFVADTSFFEVMEVLVFGMIGFALRRCRYSLASFILGLVLGPTLETNIYLTRNIYPGVSWISRRPLADALFLIGIGILVLKTIQTFRDGRKERATEAEEAAGVDDLVLRHEVIRIQQLKKWPYPLLSLITNVGLLGIATSWTIYGLEKYSFTTAIMPVLGGLLVFVPAIVRLPLEVGHYRFYRLVKQEERGIETVSSGDRDLFVPASSDLPAGSADGQEVKVEEAQDLLAVLVAPVVVEDKNDGVAAVRDKAWGLHGQYTREVVGFGWFIALLSGCWLFSFEWGVPIFCFAYGVTATKRFMRTIPRRVMFASFCALVMWGAAHELFDVMHLIFTPAVSLF